jgi:DNA-binding winged helix-turn-helix (wHTH) protein
VEFLAYVAARPHQVVSRQELVVEVWGCQPDVVSRTVDTTARRLRQKIEADPSDPQHLITVQGVGYRFEPTVSERAVRVPSPDDSQTNITIADSSFVGRGADLDALDAAFAEGARLVTLMGPGGTGKTRLARAFAARDKSLVRAVPDHGGVTRLRLLESIRVFASDRLAELGGGDAVTARHREYFLRLAAAASPDELAADRDNLLEAHARVSHATDEAGRRARVELALALAGPSPSRHELAAGPTRGVGGRLHARAGHPSAHERSVAAGDWRVPAACGTELGAM